LILDLEGGFGTLGWDVKAIFEAVSHYVKHMAMLQTLFYGCLRASELCALDIMDLNLQDTTLRVGEGKGGKDGIIFIKSEVIQIIRKYLSARPPIVSEALFITDYGTRWDRKDLWRMFSYYKRKARVCNQVACMCSAAIRLLH
jgi:integrase/recombinase XerD